MPNSARRPRTERCTSLRCWQSRPGGCSRDARVRRLATEFACQWLHIYDFDSLSEKSEKFFPEFAELRGDMYEESILFFTDLFQRDASVLSLLDADHTFVNDRLAKFYGIADKTPSADARRRLPRRRTVGAASRESVGTVEAASWGSRRRSRSNREHRAPARSCAATG